MKIDRIVANLKFKAIEPLWGTTIVETPIPRGRSQVSRQGIAAPAYSLEGHASAASSIQALEEIRDNPDWPPSYIEFPSGQSRHDGFYEIVSLESPHYPGLGIWPFRMSVRKVGTLHERRIAEYWISASESASGWSSPSNVKAISIANSASNIAFANASRVGVDGTAFFVVNPTRASVLFNISSTASDWYKAECRVYDSLTVGESSSAAWQRVFSPTHVFGGDRVFENGLTRYILSGSVGTYYVWDTVSNPNAWSKFGDWRTYFTNASHAGIIHSEIVKYTPQEVRWRELRQYGVHPMKLTYTMRRGMYHCRVKTETYSAGIDTNGMLLDSGDTSASFFKKIFNISSSGTAASGDLPAQTSSHWFAGYSSSRNWVAGFALCDKPTSQPDDTCASQLAESGAWDTSASRAFAIFAYPLDTVSFVNATACGTAASIAEQAFWSVDQYFDLPERGWYA